MIKANKNCAPRGLPAKLFTTLSKVTDDYGVTTSDDISRTRNGQQRLYTVSHLEMDYRKLIEEIIATYRKHGWQLRRVLLRSETLADAEQQLQPVMLDGAALADSEVDGLWFSRPSHEQREAWELRLLSENPFALFETFEKDETEEEREEVRKEMEARLRDYASKK